VEVKGKSYLKNDMEIECYTSKHLTIIFTLVVPVLLVWVIGFPLFILAILKRKNLDDKEVILKYGLFYIGFKDSSYYWEIIVNNLRKLVIILISIFFNSKTEEAIHSALLAMFTYLYVNHQLLKVV
jgi:hypothetical protein